MKTAHFRFVACAVLLCVLLAGFAPTVLAAPQLQWTTDRVYYDSQGRLILEGYFENTGDRTITWVNWMQIWVYFRQANTNWWLQASATARDLNIYLEPGQTRRWTFRIYNVGYSYFDHWNVRWNINYNYNN